MPRETTVHPLEKWQKSESLPPALPQRSLKSDSRLFQTQQSHPFLATVYTRNACLETRKPPALPAAFQLFLSVFNFPFLQRLQLLIQTQIALMTTGVNFSVTECAQNSTAFFLSMAAANKLTVIQIRKKFCESFRQSAFQLQVEFLCFERAESRRIHYLCPAVKTKQLHMSGGMPTASQCRTDLPRLQIKTRVQRIENTGFSYA